MIYYLIGVATAIVPVAYICALMWHQKCADCGYPLRERARRRHRAARLSSVS